MKLRALVIVSFLAVLGAPIFAANVSVPDFEMITRGYLQSGTFKLGTYGNMDIQIGGGYKFGGNLLLNFTGNNIGDVQSLSNTHLTFKAADLTIRKLFGSPFALTYFTGYGDTFANGEAFPKYFGSEPIASHFQGYYYFPTGIQYDGIYTVAGTGLKLSLPDVAKWLNTAVYLYQDANLGAGYYGSDVRLLLNFKHFKFGGFAGTSFPVSTAGIYRAGALLYYDTGSGGQFLAEAGIPRWDPMRDTFGPKLFYLLFEPRVDFGSFAIIPTVFWHPYYYNDVATNQVPTTNVNIDFRFGNPTRNPTTGGFETELDYSTTSSSQFGVHLTPYLRLVSSGVIWNFKINVQLYPFVLSNIAEGFIGVQTQF